MGITVSHQPDVSALGAVAGQVGQGQAEQQAFGNALSLYQLGQRERMQVRDINRSVWSQLAGQRHSDGQLAARLSESRLGRREGLLANQASQVYAQAGRERMAQFQRFARAEELANQEQMRNRLANADWDRQKEMIQLQQEAEQQQVEMKFTAQQRRRQQELQNGIQWVESQVDWSPEQKGLAIEQLEMEFHNIRPLPQASEAPPWPEERAPGRVWEDRGYLWSTEVDANGGVRVKMHDRAPTKEGDYDQALFERGEGVYQYDVNGKEIEVLAPPELPTQKDWNATYDSIVKSLSGGDGSPDHKEALRLTQEVMADRVRSTHELHRQRRERLLNPDGLVGPPELPNEVADGGGEVVDPVVNKQVYSKNPVIQTAFENVGAIVRTARDIRRLKNADVPFVGSQEVFDALPVGILFVDANTNQIRLKMEDSEFSSSTSLDRKYRPGVISQRANEIEAAADGR